MSTRIQAASLLIWFWPQNLIRAWKYSPYARHRAPAKEGRISEAFRRLVARAEQRWGDGRVNP